MGSQSTFIDGDYSRPSPVGARRPNYPFRQYGDRVTKGFDEDNWQTDATYTPSAFGIPYGPEMPDFYLVAETDPKPIFANVSQFTRTWSRIPANAIKYPSINITKPAPSNIGTVLNVTGGGFCSGTGTGTVVGNAVLLTNYFWGNNQVFGARAAVTNSISGGNTRLVWTAHGLAGTETICAYTNSSPGYVFTFVAGAYTVVDANTVDLLGVSGTPYSGIIYAAKFYRNYTPGTAPMRVRSTQKFYLPGVSSGITTGADIALAPTKLNDADFLAAVLANLTGYVSYDSDPIDFWNSTCFYQQTFREINIADA